MNSRIRFNIEIFKDQYLLNACLALVVAQKIKDPLVKDLLLVNS